MRAKTATYGISVTNKRGGEAYVSASVDQILYDLSDHESWRIDEYCI